MDVYRVSKDQLIGKPCTIITEHRRNGANLEPDWRSLYLKVFDLDHAYWHASMVDGAAELNFYKVKVEKLKELKQDQFVGDFQTYQEHFDEMS